MSQIATIAVKCDSELAKTMRTDDPKRDSVVAAVNEQSALVKEIVRTILKEMRDFCGPRIADGIINLLRTANISEAEQLKQLYSDFDDMKWKAYACELKTWATSPCERQAAKTKTTDQCLLAAVTNRYLSQHITKPYAPSRIRSLIRHPGCDRPEDTQGLCNEGSRSEERTSSDTGADQLSGFSRSFYIRTIALPDVQPFGGRPHECFKSILRDKWRDSSHLQSFQSFLRKDHIRNLEIRERSFHDVVEAMKKRMRVDGNTERKPTQLEKLMTKVKESALRLERSIRAAAECRNAPRTKPTQRFKSNWERSKDEPRSFLGLNNSESAKTQKECKVRNAGPVGEQVNRNCIAKDLLSLQLWETSAFCKGLSVSKSTGKDTYIHRAN
ncbi:hypothetical protein COOONC_16668 [Cooperia oncophora]